VRRMPEPELMADEAQAEAYAAADLSELQQVMVSCFQSRCGALAEGGTLLDLGCGAGDMTIRFVRAHDSITALGVDGSEPLLRHAQTAVRESGLSDRVQLEQRRIPDAALETRSFDAVIANSLLHHLTDPATLWRTAIRGARPGAPVMVMDLRRPESLSAARTLVARHAREARPVLRQDFFNSLRAAYRTSEIRRQLDDAGLEDFQVEEIGDMHVLAWGFAPRDVPAAIGF
jgi:cyclopropane fatty-acyl-phospholipid synthase-like methyltransferase